MFNNEQLKVLKKCLDNNIENLISIYKIWYPRITQIQKDVDLEKVENEVINQLSSHFTRKL